MACGEMGAEVIVDPCARVGRGAQPGAECKREASECGRPEQVEASAGETRPRRWWRTRGVRYLSVILYKNKNYDFYF